MALRNKTTGHLKVRYYFRFSDIALFIQPSKLKQALQLYPEAGLTPEQSSTVALLHAALKRHADGKPDLESIMIDDLA